MFTSSGFRDGQGDSTEAEVWGGLILPIILIGIGLFLSMCPLEKSSQFEAIGEQQPAPHARPSHK